MSGEEHVYEVWSEGYAVTGQQAHAYRLGSARARSFREACEKVADALAEPGFYDPERNTYWGCRLFPTQAAARKSFG